MANGSQDTNYYSSPGRYYDQVTKQTVVKVMSGDYYASSNHNEMLMTILGSCIAVCIYDPITNTGGMNHFLLPGDESSPNSSRYGVNAMELLINKLLHFGCCKKNLQFKIFGGANVLNKLSSADIGIKNIKFIENFIKKEGYTLVSKDVGGKEPRRIHFYPTSGKVMLRKLTQVADLKVIDEEIAYLKKIKRIDKKQENNITIF